jgi:membrane glycosyltransferase
VIAGRMEVGDKLARNGFLCIPEDVHGSKLLDELKRMPITDSTQAHSAFVQAVVDPIMNQVQCQLARGNRGGSKLKRLHILRRQCLSEGPKNLTHKEITLLARDRESLAWLHREVWRSLPGSFWAEQIALWRNEARQIAMLQTAPQV